MLLGKNGYLLFNVYTIHTIRIRDVIRKQEMYVRTKTELVLNKDKLMYKIIDQKLNGTTLVRNMSAYKVLLICCLLISLG